MGIQGTVVEIEKPGDLVWWKSSGWGERGSCSNCGASLFWRLQRGKGNWVLNPSTFDEPLDLKLDMHIYVDEMPDYYDLDDDATRMTGKEFTKMVFSEMKQPMRLFATVMYALQQLRSGKQDKDLDEAASRKGRCLCGAAKFTMDKEAGDITMCQCSLCLKINGGVAGLWAAADGVSFEDESTLGWWLSPGGIERAHCRKCGTPLAKRKAGDERIQISVGALEDSSGMTTQEILHEDQSPAYIHLTANKTSKAAA